MTQTHTITRPLQQDARTLLQRVLPQLERLGDFIGNGDIDPDRPGSLGARCDLILDIKDYLETPDPEKRCQHCGMRESAHREEFQGARFSGAMDCLGFSARPQEEISRLRLEEGWEVIDSSYGKEIQADDSAGIFEDDIQAVEVVLEGALRGKDYCLLALDEIRYRPTVFGTLTEALKAVRAVAEPGTVNPSLEDALDDSRLFLFHGD